jgi:hypothetical protein
MIDPDRQELTVLEEKALRLVSEGRVHVTWIESRGVAATGKVDGDNDTYSVAFSPAGGICTCPAGAHHRRCSHAIALELRVAAGRTRHRVNRSPGLC